MKLLKNVFTDIPMFFTKNSFTGDLSVKKDINAIKESIKNIILTIYNERPFDTEFGTNVSLGLFENPSDFSFYVENRISIALQQYEPRIRLESLNSEITGRTILIYLEFSVLNYDLVDSLSITFERV